MKYYAPENAAFLLPFQFEPAALTADFEKCLKYDFLQNYVPANYNGKDYILPLRSIDGKLNFPAAAPNQAHRFKNTTALEQCSYFQEVIGTFLCEKEAIRLMSLPPGAVFNTHTDHGCSYEDGVFRIHIPILTNEEVYFILNDQRLIMLPGQAWYTNVSLPHNVANKGSSKRVHLVMDCIRNKWSDDLFRSLGYDFEQEREVEENFSEETLYKMIRELELQDTAAAKTLIEQYKAQLATK